MTPQELVLLLIKFTLCIGLAALIIGIGYLHLLNRHTREIAKYDQVQIVGDEE